MSEKRITKRDNFNEIRDILEKIGREDLVAFVDNELNLLAKKAAKTTLTKTQKENIAILDDIFNALSNCNKPVTAAELIVSDDRLAELRSLKELDEFRSEEFPDDILVFFFKEGFSTEGMWVRYEDMNENKEIVGTLINNPNQNLGIKEGDRVKFKLSEDYGGLACCCNLDE